MKLLTLNVWGAPYAKHRQQRNEAISQEVKQLNPDILCFQEIYLPNEREKLINLLCEEWQHYHYFPSALVGSGLLTMSKFPIIDTAFFKFRMQGKPEALKHGDYYAGKGIGLARIDTPDGVIDVYNCHTHAQYEPDNDNEYAVFNETNLYDAARFIDSYSGASPVILCGDLNTRPDQAGYRIITQLGSLVDANLAMNGNHQVTFSADNPYVSSDNQCLDYVLMRNFGVETVELAMTAHFTGEMLAYSDHYGLLVTLSTEVNRLQVSTNTQHQVLLALKARVDEALLDTEAQQISYLERAVFGVASILDGLIISAFVKRFSNLWAKWLRTLGIFSAIVFALYYLIQAGLNLENRKNTLKAIQSELQKQVNAGRLFDGREL